MNFENKAPKWDAAGAEPSEDLQKNGFLAGYKPPAPYFNFLFHVYTKCINELQALLKAHGEDTENPHDVTAEQVGARPNTWMPTASDVGAVSKGNFVLNGFTKVTHEKYESGGEKRLISFYSLSETEFWRVDTFVDAIRYRYIKDGTTLHDYTCRNSDNYLPLSGGTLSGVLGLTNGWGELSANADETVLMAHRIANSKTYTRHLSLKAGESVDKINYLKLATNDNGSWASYQIFGTHNKPSGSYTGNGSATQRTINVGGIGEVLTITSDVGMALVTNRGAICLNRQTGALSGLKSYEVNYQGGVLTIATANTFVNGNPTAYWYQVL